MTDNASPPPASHPWFDTDPDLLDRFADELEDLVRTLERTRSTAIDAAIFHSPSADPVSQRATRQLARDGTDLDGTPVRAVSTAIRDLRGQIDTARLAARDYRALDERGRQDIAVAEEPDE